MNDPVRALDDTHRELNIIARSIGQLLRAAGGDTDEQWREPLRVRLEVLRDELLEHFANEEEALFPFIRANLPVRLETVDRLEAGHDTICGTVVRLAHLAARESDASNLASLTLVYERFEDAYAAHSREEAELFDDLGRTLTERQQHELADLMRGLT